MRLDEALTIAIEGLRDNVPGQRAEDAAKVLEDMRATLSTGRPLSRTVVRRTERDRWRGAPRIDPGHN